MKQVRFEAFGRPEDVLHCVEVDEVGPSSANEIVVAVEAFPINPADLLTATGEYGRLPELPATLGGEAVGRISAVGASWSRRAAPRSRRCTRRWPR